MPHIHLFLWFSAAWVQNFPSRDLIVTLLDRVMVFGRAIRKRECTLYAKPFVGISIYFPLPALWLTIATLTKNLTSQHSASSTSRSVLDLLPRSSP